METVRFTLLSLREYLSEAMLSVSLNALTTPVNVIGDHWRSWYKIIPRTKEVEA